MPDITLRTSHFVPNLEPGTPMDYICGMPESFLECGTVIPRKVDCPECIEAMHEEVREYAPWERELLHGTDWAAGRDLPPLPART
jgi:hypothetical protein